MHFRRFLLVLLALWDVPAFALPLSTVPSFCTLDPLECGLGGQSLLAARGTGTNDYYVLEVDPTTGELPVSIATGITVDYSGATGAAVPTDAAFVGGTDGTLLRGIKTDTSGELQVDVLSSALPSGAATSAKQDTAQTTLDAIDTKLGGTLDVSAAQSGAWTVAATQSGTWSLRLLDGSGNSIGSTGGALNVNVSDGSGPVTVDGTVAVSNLPATVDTAFGTPGASTPRSAAMLGVGTTAVSSTNPVPTNGIGKSYADSVRNDYSSTNVTTGAWVEVIASTAAAINVLYITDTCGQVLELGTGAAASEARKLLIPRGGMAEPVWLAVPAATRISLRAISDNCTTGDFVLTGLL